MKQILIPALLELIEILKEIEPKRTLTARQIINTIILQAETHNATN